MLSIVDGKIDVEKIGELDSTYDDFLTDLKQMEGDKKDCRFAGKQSKLLTILRCHDLGCLDVSLSVPKLFSRSLRGF